MEALEKVQFNQDVFLRKLNARLLSFAQAMQFLGAAFLRNGNAIHQTFYGAYLKAGAPYGE